MPKSSGLSIEGVLGVGIHTHKIVMAENLTILGSLQLQQLMMKPAYQYKSAQLLFFSTVVICKRFMLTVLEDLG